MRRSHIGMMVHNVEEIPRSYIPLREVNWRIVLCFFIFVTVCLFFYRQLDYVANGEMIGRLGDLLRQLLKSDRSQEITLARELELLQLYTRIMEARLEDRLKLTVDIDETTRQALVPQLVLQPLAENAILHGMNSLTFEAQILVQARREGDCLHLAIRDHGPGLDTSVDCSSGIGLSNIQRIAN